MTARHKESDEDIEQDFHALVNMSARELADWLETEESKSAGWRHEGEAESIGHQSGRHIIGIQRGAAGSRKTTAPTCARSSHTSSGTSRSAHITTWTTPAGDTRS